VFPIDAKQLRLQIDQLRRYRGRSDILSALRGWPVPDILRAILWMG
jgi:hypothetical protein